MESVVEGLIGLDSKGVITFLSPSAARMLGYDPEDLVGRPMHEAIHYARSDGSPYPVAECPVTVSLREGRERHVPEGVVWRKDGTPLSVEYTSRPTRNRGRLTGAIIVMRDESDGEQIEVRLREGRSAVARADRDQSLISAALERTGIAQFTVTGATGRVLDASDRSCEYLGYTREELLTLAVSDFDPLFPRDRFHELTAPIREQGWHRFESIHQTRDGRRIPVEITAVYTPAQDDAEARIMVFAVEITERKEAEAQLIQAREDAEQALKSRERDRAFLDTLLDALPVAVFYKDLEGCFLGGNRVFEEMSGLTIDDIRSRTAIEVWPGELGSTNHRRDLGVVESGLPQTYETRIDTSRGERWDVLMHKQAFADERGRVAGVIGVAVNISELKRTERLLQQAKLEADAANQAKSTFLATMSHEIRTPLNGVVGTIDMLMHTGLSPDQKDLVRTAHDSSLLLQRVIDDVLDFSKIEAGRLDLERIPVSLETLLDTVGENLRYQAVKLDVALLIYFDPRLPTVLGDPVRLNQILFNLAGNAVKFSSNLAGRHGEVVASIVMMAHSEGRVDVLIEVKDNGIGMSDEVRARIFQPFVQGEDQTTRRFGGTGLGLVITRRLVDMMGGRVEVQSEEGRGSTFSVRVTLDEADATADVGDVSLRGLHTLLVEDADEPARILADYLRHAGAKVTSAKPAGALSACRRLAESTGQPLVIVIDDYRDDKVASAVEQLRREAGDLNLRFVLVARGRRSAPRPHPDGGLTLDLNAMRRRTLLNAVETVAGRSSSYGRRRADPGSFRAEPLSREEAVAAGRLVLLTDDNEINRRVIGRQLAMLGYGVEYAVHGEQALEKWRTGDIDLLLTDCHMPVMDGFALSRAIRDAEGEGRRTPILAITADASREAIRGCFEAGMDECLTKPIRLEKLREVLDRVLEAELPSPAGQRSKGGADAMVAGGASATPVDAATLGTLIGITDPVQLADVYRAFLEADSPTAEQMSAAYASGDTEELRRLAHKLKSAARTVGAGMLASICEAVEAACAAGDASRISVSMERFPHLFEQVESWIERYSEQAGGDEA